MPLVSVIIPTYGHRDFVHATLDSVFAQTFTDHEVIVVNDGSPDDTAAVLRPWVADGRIRYLEQPNAGQAAARNRGLREAGGEFVAFLDDDDLWPADNLAWQVAALRADPGLVAVAGQAVTVDAAGQPGGPIARNVGVVDRARLYAGCPFVSPGQVLVRRSALTAVGGLDPTVRGADDFDLWFRLTAVGRIEAADRVALWYRLHPTNASKDVAHMLRQVATVVRKHLAEETAADRPARRRVAYRYLYHYCGGPLVAQVRGHLCRLQFGQAARKALGLRPLAVSICTDRQIARSFLRAWMPRRGPPPALVT